MLVGFGERRAAWIIRSHSAVMILPESRLIAAGEPLFQDAQLYCGAGPDIRFQNVFHLP